MLSDFIGFLSEFIGCSEWRPMRKQGIHWSNEW